MTLFLTSHIGGSMKVEGKRIPAQLYSDNELLVNLRQRWCSDARILLIAADPQEWEKSDAQKECFLWAFPHGGLTVGTFDIWDSRNPERDLRDYDVLILSGGHVPTQNRFFQQIGLKDMISRFDGIVIGISAGTMNSAQTVYVHPELEGEATDPAFQRFQSGLGLTKCMVIPHYQKIFDGVLDGLRLFEDIAYPDSMGRHFYALPDGSYILTENGQHTLYGEGFLIRDGQIRQICQANSKLLLEEERVTVKDLVDSGICPTCYDKVNNHVLYGNNADRMLYENNIFECLLVGNPRCAGHTIISTKEHYKDMMETPDEVVEAVFLFARKCMTALKKVYGSESVYLCTMCDGPMNHFHVQLIPRYSFEKRGSNNFVKERKSYTPEPEKIKQMRAMLCSQKG